MRPRLASLLGLCLSLGAAVQAAPPPPASIQLRPAAIQRTLPASTRGLVDRLADLVRQDPLTVSQAAFAYCKPEEDCSSTRVLRIGKEGPMQFRVYTEAIEKLKDRRCEFTVEVLDMEGEALFERSFELPLTYVPHQLSSITYRQQPEALRRLEPGRYKYRATVMTVDGEVEATWERVINAKR